MRRSTKIVAVCTGALAAITALLVLDRRPMEVSDVIEHAFGYRVMDEPAVVSRKWQKPFGIQGVAYYEDTILRLSESDYRELSTRLVADRSFEKKFGTHEFYERIVVGRHIVSWQPTSSPELRFTYTEY
jgi:hypothetical protein